MMMMFHSEEICFVCKEELRNYVKYDNSTSWVFHELSNLITVTAVF